jgi:hypothetical protein
MAKEKNRKALEPGDRVNVRFGNRVVPGVVTRVSGDRIHIELSVEGADEPVATLFRNDQLVSV